LFLFGYPKFHFHRPPHPLSPILGPLSSTVLELTKPLTFLDKSMGLRNFRFLLSSTPVFPLTPLGFLLYLNFFGTLRFHFRPNLILFSLRTPVPSDLPTSVCQAFFFFLNHGEFPFDFDNSPRKSFFFFINCSWFWIGTYSPIFEASFTQFHSSEDRGIGGFLGTTSPPLFPLPSEKTAKLSPCSSDSPQWVLLCPFSFLTSLLREFCTFLRHPRHAPGHFSIYSFSFL